jgi:hypothetical protein
MTTDTKTQLCLSKIGWGAIGLTFALFTILVMNAGRGFDITDEGYYLLSASHPGDVLAPTNGFFFLPAAGLLDAVGGDIAAFRRIGILLLLGSAIFLGNGLRTCLQTMTGRALGARSAWVGALMIGALGYYTIGILTPSYNLLTLLGIMLAYGCLLHGIEAAPRRQIGWLIGAGIATTFTLVSKWPSGIVLATGLSAWLILWPVHGTDSRWKRLGALWSGIVIALFACMVFIAPSDAIRRFNDGWTFLSGLASPHADGVLVRYAGQLGDVLLRALGMAVIPLLILTTSSRGRRLGITWWPIVTFIWFAGIWWWTGTVIDRTILLTIMISWLLVTVGCRWALALERRQPADASNPAIGLIVLAFIALPFVFAVGTGTSLPRTAGSATIGLICAIMLLMWSGARCTGSRSAVPITAFLLALVVCWSTMNWQLAPYRQNTMYDMQNSDVAFGTEGGEIALDVDSAAFFTTLRGTAEANDFTTGTDVIGVMNMPGVVYALGGRAPGIPWLHGRYPGSIETCVYGLELAGRDRLHDAWVLTSDRAGLDPNVITEAADRRFPDDYAYCGQSWWPNDMQRGFVQLWKPSTTGTTRTTTDEPVSFTQPIDVETRGQNAGPFIVDGVHGRFRIEPHESGFRLIAIEPSPTGTFAIQMTLDPHSMPWLESRDAPELVTWRCETGPTLFMQQTMPSGLYHLDSRNFRVHPDDHSFVERVLDAGDESVRLGLNWNPAKAGDHIDVTGLEVEHRSLR